MKLATTSACVVALLGLTHHAVAKSGDWQPVPNNGIIATSGRYYLQEDMKTDRGTGIKIDANDVTIDLCGHALRYTGAPKEGVFGIASPGRKRVTITNGTLGGFWFNMHCTQNEKLRIRDIHFDDIPYIGINVAQSKDVEICDNLFDNFRYDLPKDKINHYLVGINIGAKDAIITNNRFSAHPQMAAKDVDIETVFVLFSAEVTKKCLVAKNELVASDVLPKSYGVWLANNTQATIADNTIRNMKYGVCLAGDASALVCANHFDVSSNAAGIKETIGVSASSAKDIVETRNTFDGVSLPAALPEKAKAERVNGG